MSFSVSFVRQNTGIFTVEKHTIDLNRDTTNETKKKILSERLYIVRFEMERKKNRVLCDQRAIQGLKI